MTPSLLKNGAFTGGQASQAILYGTAGKNVGPYNSWYTAPIQSPRILLGPLMNADTGATLTESDY